MYTTELKVEQKQYYYFMKIRYRFWEPLTSFFLLYVVSVHVVAITKYYFIIFLSSNIHLFLQIIFILIIDNESQRKGKVYCCINHHRRHS
jgi:hypothetical protein